MKILYFTILYLSINIYIAEGTTPNKIKKLVIFQTSDIHSHIDSKEPGWLDMAEMIKRDRTNSGGQNKTLLIDCGDTIPGSILGVVSHGKAAISLLNAMHYDAWILGNHDLEFGFKRLNEISKKCSADIIAANLIPEEKNNFIKWKLYIKNGIKAAVIGLTSPHIKEWLWGNKTKHYNIISTEKAIESTMNEILQKHPNIIILAIHHGRFTPNRLNGFNIKKIADKYPQIDLILGAHSHQEVPGEKCGITTWYVESGAHAKKYAKIEITVNLKTGNTQKINSKLIPVTKQSHISHEFNNAIKKWKTKATNFAKTLIGTTTNDITATMTNLRFSPVSKLFCMAIQEKTHADFVFHGSVIQSAKLAGKIYQKDLFNLIPYEDTICLLKLTPEELKIIINEQMKKRKINHFQSYYGLNVNFDYQNRITLTFNNNTPLIQNKRYLTAFSSYALAGAGGRFPELKKIAAKKTSEGVDTNNTIRDALKQYIQKHSPIKIRI